VLTTDRVATPRDSKGFEPHNQLLAALPDRHLQSLQPHLDATPLASGSVLVELDEPLTHVYFVETGVVSLLTTLENRATVGAATVGREGAVGIASLVLSGEHALGRYKVLVPGSALTMEVPAFRRALRQRPKLCTACEAHTRSLFVQMLQAVPCTSRLMKKSLARWPVA
jgi:CRP-like cAMP-binding protein